MSRAIFLNDILKLEETLNLNDLDNVRIRFLMKCPKYNFDPYQKYINNKNSLCQDQYVNFSNSKKSFRLGDTTIGFVRIDENDKDKWLLFHIGKVITDLNTSGVGYSWKIENSYKKYFGRLVIKYHNISRGAIGLVHKANNVINKCEVIYYSTFKDFI